MLEYEYGIEYAFKLKSGFYLTILNTSTFKERLKKTPYYRNRLLFYLNNNIHIWREPVEQMFSLTNLEEKIINSKFAELKDTIVESGFYDVGYIKKTSILNCYT